MQSCDVACVWVYAGHGDEESGSAGALRGPAQ